MISARKHFDDSIILAQLVVHLLLVEVNQSPLGITVSWACSFKYMPELGNEIYKTFRNGASVLL